MVINHYHDISDFNYHDSDNVVLLMMNYEVEHQLIAIISNQEHIKTKYFMYNCSKQKSYNCQFI